MFLSKSDIKDLNEKIKEIFDADILSKKNQIEQKENIIYKDGFPIFFYKKEILIPHLKLLQANNILKKIVVDMPAVPYMVKGADVMRPGIKEIDEGIRKGMLVSIVDEKNKKAIAVGISEFSTEELRVLKTGKVIKNIHWVGDEIWKM